MLVSKNFTRLTHIIKLKENERSFYARVTKVKLERAYDECLGIRSRRRT